MLGTAPLIDFSGETKAVSLTLRSYLGSLWYEPFAAVDKSDSILRLDCV